MHSHRLQADTGVPPLAVKQLLNVRADGTVGKDISVHTSRPLFLNLSLGNNNMFSRLRGFVMLQRLRRSSQL